MVREQSRQCQRGELHEGAVGDEVPIEPGGIWPIGSCLYRRVNTVVGYAVCGHVLDCNDVRLLDQHLRFVWKVVWIDHQAVGKGERVGRARSDVEHAATTQSTRAGDDISNGSISRPVALKQQA